MNIENAKSQMRKGMLEYCVLLLLKHRPSYASDIIQQLKNAELLVVEGTLYPLLTRLKNDGAKRGNSSLMGSTQPGTNSTTPSIISKTSHHNY